VVLNHNSVTAQADSRDFSLQLFYDTLYKQISWIFPVSCCVPDFVPENEELTVEVPSYFSPTPEHLTDVEIQTLAAITQLG